MTEAAVRHAPRQKWHRITETEDYIESRVPLSIVKKPPNDILFLAYMVEDLIAMGVPIVGGIAIRGVSSGSLSMYQDGYDMVYHWQKELE